MEGSVKMQSSKESGMTQLELAEKMGVTDKSVCSNRNLFESPSSCLLAQEFCIF